MSRRALVLIDGNNFYHSLAEAGISGWLDYGKISQKLIWGREWVGTRYYIGQMPNTPPYEKDYDEQQKFLAGIKAQDPKISCHMGRMEFRPVKNEAAKELRAYVGNLRTPIDRGVRTALLDLATKHIHTKTLSEKAVDVMIAVDLILGAKNDDYDDAFILSADGDYTPAVSAVQAMGKKVFAASTATCAQLAGAVHKFIPLTKDWFVGCY